MFKTSDKEFTVEEFHGHTNQELKKREKAEAKIRFGKKKNRQFQPASEAFAHLNAMVDKYQKKPNKPPKKTKKKSRQYVVEELESESE